MYTGKEGEVNSRMLYLNELTTKGGEEEEEKEKEKEKTHNCLHIPQGDAGGLISVATAKALKSLWPATCES